MLNHIRHSLFFRLLLIFGLTILLLFLVASAASRLLWKDKFEHEHSRDYFSRYVMMFIDDIGVPPDYEKAESLSKNLPIDLVIKGPDGVWQPAGGRMDIEPVKKIRSLDNQIAVVGSEQLRGLKVTKGEFDYYLFWKGHLLNDDDFIVVYLSVAVALAVLFFNYWLVRRLFKPIRQLKDGAHRISQGELDYRVPSTRQDELGELTGSINTMADSLQEMLEAKQQLLLAISHELRSPITRAKVQLEFIDDEEIKDSLAEELNELDLLVSELLEAERLNSQHNALQKELVPIGLFVEQTIKQFWPRHPEINIDLPDNDVSISIDKLRMSLLLRNLISNALQYGNDQPINVTVSNAAQGVTLSVQDHGEGIKQEHLEHLVEPFYRADSARQRQTGGFGLGLYLCKLIAEAHQGRLEIKSAPEEGTCVSVVLPI